MTGLRPQLESKFSDVHSHRAPSWKITCRTVQVLPECLRLSTIPAVHCNVAAKGFSLGIQNKFHSPTSGPAGYHPIRKRNSRSMCADFAAHGRPGLSNRECHWIAPVLLATVQPGPWLRPAISYFPYRTRQTCQRDKVTGQPRQIKQKQTNSRTSQPPIDTRGEGGSHGGGCVCVCVCVFVFPTRLFCKAQRSVPAFNESGVVGSKDWNLVKA